MMTVPAPNGPAEHAPPSTVRASKLEMKFSERVEEHRRQADAEKQAVEQALLLEAAAAAAAAAASAPEPKPATAPSRALRASNSSGMKAKHLTTTQLKLFLSERGVEIPPDATRAVLEALRREAEGDPEGEATSASDREQIEAALEQARAKQESLREREELRQIIEAKLAGRV